MVTELVLERPFNGDRYMSPEDLSVGDWEYEDKVVVRVQACDNVAHVLVNISTVKKKIKK